MTASKSEPDFHSPNDDPNHSHNFGIAILYMVLMRVGWIFKTESIIMPAVLDAIGGSGWLRGFLPMLNRFGQSIPPLLASDQIRNAQLKKYRLCTTTTSMGCCFLLLSLVWYFSNGTKTWWLPIVFLIFYGLFFVSTGINLLVLNTLTGKLIRVNRRGMMSLWGTVFGAAIAVALAWFLLRDWLVDEATVSSAAPTGTPRFGTIFLFTGVTFVLAGILVLFLKERPDQFFAERRSTAELLKSVAQTLKSDRNFLKLAIIAGLFGMCLTLFPHYQRLGRDSLSLSITALVPWVIAQNLGAAFFSIPTGWIADRFGNRLVLRLAMITLCVPPILSIVLSRLESPAPFWFTIVFGLLGLTPVAMRYLNNYTLEVCGNQDHPRYLSTMSIAMSAPPILLGPFIGGMVDWISFEFVFILVTCCIFAGWLMTFTIAEPRNAT